MNTQRIDKHLNQISSMAEGLSLVAWMAQFILNECGELDPEKIELMQLQVENIQADLDDLKREVQP